MHVHHLKVTLLLTCLVAVGSRLPSEVAPFVAGHHANALEVRLGRGVDILELERLCAVVYQRRSQRPLSPRWLYGRGPPVTIHGRGPETVGDCGAGCSRLWVWALHATLCYSTVRDWRLLHGARLVAALCTAGSRGVAYSAKNPPLLPPHPKGSPSTVTLALAPALALAQALAPNP